MIACRKPILNPDYLLK